jgi:hypothetical protein
MEDAVLQQMPVGHQNGGDAQVPDVVSASGWPSPEMTAWVEKYQARRAEAICLLHAIAHGAKGVATDSAKDMLF